MELKLVSTEDIEETNEVDLTFEMDDELKDLLIDRFGEDKYEEEFAKLIKEILYDFVDSHKENKQEKE